MESYFLADDRGYYSFFPDDVKDDARIRLIFTRLTLNGSEVVPTEGGILKWPVWQTKEIRLSYNQNNISLEFIGINYLNPGNTNYVYTLENFETEWHPYGSEHKVYYYNLPPGNYVFHVKASNQNGIWSEKSMSIIVSPPWWRSWWAYTIWGLFVIAAIWGIISYRSRTLRRENRLLEERVTRRTTQLNKSLED